MDLLKIKNLIKQNGDKVILVENGEPEMVVMSFEEYEKLSKNNSVDGRLFSNPPLSSPGPERSNFSTPVLPRKDSVSTGLADWGGEKLNETEFVIPAVTDSSVSLPLRLEDIRLEDLPV